MPQDNPRAVTDNDLSIFFYHKPDKPVADIIAIPGLGAHPDDTWCYNLGRAGKHASESDESDKRATTNKRWDGTSIYSTQDRWQRWLEQKRDTQWINWLEDSDMLAADFSDCRIGRFGYFSEWKGEERVSTRYTLIADELLQALCIQRKECPPKRPLIFIAHSFGGLVVLQALISATLQGLDDIYSATVGAVFIGTPFRGLSGDGLPNGVPALARKTLGVGSVTEDVLRILQYPDQITDLRTDFFKLVKTRGGPSMVCMIEKHPTDIYAILGKHHANAHPKEMLITADSALLDGAEALYVERDHFSMNKFSWPEDGMFVRLKHMLREMIDAADATMVNGGASLTSSAALPSKARELREPHDQAMAALIVRPTHATLRRLPQPSGLDPAIDDPGVTSFVQDYQTTIKSFTTFATNCFQLSNPSFVWTTSLKQSMVSLCISGAVLFDRLASVHASLVRTRGLDTVYRDRIGALGTAQLFEMFDLQIDMWSAAQAMSLWKPRGLQNDPDVDFERPVVGTYSPAQLQDLCALHIEAWSFAHALFLCWPFDFQPDLEAGIEQAVESIRTLEQSIRGLHKQLSTNVNELDHVSVDANFWRLSGDLSFTEVIMNTPIYRRALQRRDSLLSLNGTLATRQSGWTELDGLARSLFSTKDNEAADGTSALSVRAMPNRKKQRALSKPGNSAISFLDRITAITDPDVLAAKRRVASSLGISLSISDATELISGDLPFTVDLSHLDLDALPASALKAMQEHVYRLLLGRNPRVRLLPELQLMDKLTELEMPGCSFGRIPDVVFKLTNLQVLNVRKNAIEDLPQNLTHMKSLSYLFLGNNFITRLPHFLMDMTELVQLELDGNPLIYPPKVLEWVGQYRGKDWQHRHVCRLVKQYMSEQVGQYGQYFAEWD